MKEHTNTWKHASVNYVNLIGNMSSDPRIAVLPGGRRVAQFSMSTREMYLDEQGKMCTKQNWHRMTAWGRWVNILEELTEKGVAIAVEGKLVSRYYQLASGKRQMISEIEINDLVIL